MNQKRIRNINYNLENDEIPYDFFLTVSESLKEKYEELYKEFEEFLIYKDAVLNYPISSNKLIRINQIEQKNIINELRNKVNKDLISLGCFIEEFELFDEKENDLIDRIFPKEEIKKGIFKATTQIMNDKKLFEIFIEVIYSSIINQNYKHFYSEFYNILESNIKGMEIDNYSSLYSDISVQLTYEIFKHKLPKQKKPNMKVSKGSKYGTPTTQLKRTNPSKKK